MTRLSYAISPSASERQRLLDAEHGARTKPPDIFMLLGKAEFDEILDKPRKGTQKIVRLPIDLVMLVRARGHQGQMTLCEE